MARALPLLGAAAVVAVALAYLLGGGAGEPRRGSSALGPREAPRAAPGVGGATPQAGQEALVEAPARTTSAPRGAATSEAPPPRLELLTVRAVEAGTKRPVQSFFVTVLPTGVHAQGRDGVATLEAVFEREFTVHVQGPEHEKVARTCGDPFPDEVSVTLPQRPGVRGVVRHADARPAPDVALRIEPLPDPTEPPPGDGTGPRPSYATLARTDGDGRYRFAPLPPGAYKVTAEYLGRTVGTIERAEVTEGMTDLPEVRLESGGRLEVAAFLADGQPRGEALVVVVPAEGSAIRRYTDGEGKLVLEPLPRGRYTVVLPAQGGMPEQSRELELVGGLVRETFRAGDPAPTDGRPPGGGAR